jgi:hypothetical protein
MKAGTGLRSKCRISATIWGSLALVVALQGLGCTGDLPANGSVPRMSASDSGVAQLSYGFGPYEPCTDRAICCPPEAVVTLGGPDTERRVCLTLWTCSLANKPGKCSAPMPLPTGSAGWECSWSEFRYGCEATLPPDQVIDGGAGWECVSSRVGELSRWTCAYDYPPNPNNSPQGSSYFSCEPDIEIGTITCAPKPRALSPSDAAVVADPGGNVGRIPDTVARAPDAARSPDLGGSDILADGAGPDAFVPLTPHARLLVVDFYGVLLGSGAYDVNGLADQREFPRSERCEAPYCCYLDDARRPNIFQVKRLLYDHGIALEAYRIYDEAGTGSFGFQFGAEKLGELAMRLDEFDYVWIISGETDFPEFDSVVKLDNPNFKTFAAALGRHENLRLFLNTLTGEWPHQTSPGCPWHASYGAAHEHAQAILEEITAGDVALRETLVGNPDDNECHFYQLHALTNTILEKGAPTAKEKVLVNHPYLAGLDRLPVHLQTATIDNHGPAAEFIPLAYGAMFPPDTASTTMLAVKDLPRNGRVLIDVDAGKFERKRRMMADLCTFTGSAEQWAANALVSQYVVHVFTQLLTDAR